MNSEITLAQVLAAKEARYERQVRLRERYGLTLASITINMPGAGKDFPVVRRLADYALQELIKKLPAAAWERVNLPTGPEGLAAIAMDAEAVKAAAVKLEETYSFGRLLDIDVFDETGKLLSRKDHGEGRRCFVCQRSALECTRGRTHSREELQQSVEKMLQAFLAWETRKLSPAAEKLGAAAVESMLYEAASTPAPGLVDRVNSGAHRDMDFYTFLASSAALSLTMARCAQAGLNHDGAMAELLPVLRIIGLEGEVAMFSATSGINTQKGLLFVLGLAAAAAGKLISRGGSCQGEQILEAMAELAAGIVERELSTAAAKKAEKLTAGERLYIEHGITGVRGEVEQGLPVVRLYGLPVLQKALQEGLPLNAALVQALLVIMLHLEDTTVMHRHHPDILDGWVRPKVAKVLAAGGMFTAEGQAMTENLDKLFIEQNISPGGAADLLAVTWFIHRVSQLYV